MKKPHKKISPNKKNPPQKVKRSNKATGVNENLTSKGKSIYTRRSPFADEIGTAIPDPNKVIR